MTDPVEIADAIQEVEDAFSHGHGKPEFEERINSSAEADEGEVMLQKGCRYIEAGELALLEDGYYSSAMEHAFSAIERTFEGYLVLIAGDDPDELRDHSTPYARARAQVPLDEETIDAVEGFYESNRTTYYYGTAVASHLQAQYLLKLATLIHSRIVEFDEDLIEICVCEDG